LLSTAAIRFTFFGYGLRKPCIYSVPEAAYAAVDYYLRNKGSRGRLAWTPHLREA